MPKPINKAVFPVAGLGTRFLPATKAMPKEMLPVVDRPVIQHVVDEARAAGIEQLIFVTGRNKGVIADHFDRQVELEETLRERGREEELARLAADLPGPGAASFTRQQEPLGLGHAVWCARHLVGDEPFALLLPDVLMQGPRPCIAEMAAQYEKTGGNLIAVEQVAPEEAHRYGIVELAEPAAEGQQARRIAGMVEKPAPGTAPSDLMITGRYILQPEIFDILTSQGAGAGGEIQLTDAMRTLMDSQPFYAVPYDGRSHDCGSRVGFLTANIAFALERPDLRGELLESLTALLADMAAREKAGSGR